MPPEIAEGNFEIIFKHGGEIGFLFFR
jgi:hypothetical protein